MIKKLTSLSIMGLLFPMIVSAYTPKKEALLVGIETYQYIKPNLFGIKKDIQQMKNLLEHRGFHVKVLFNQKATLANVTQALNSYRDLNANDSFFFYDSSHGTQIEDQNGDEEDGLDEAYILYDANSDISNEQGLLIDDHLDNMLSAIPAKKVMVSDSCYSGTMYKSFSRNAQSKSLKASHNFKFINKSSVLGAVHKPKNLVVFGASSDNQKSIATSSGSLFTEAFYDAWSNNPKITFKEMQHATSSHIKNICNNSRDLNVHTPTLYSTNRNFIDKSINDFLQVNIQINAKKYLVEEYLDDLMSSEQVGQLGLNAKGFYNKGEHITFNINTLGKQGHLYILSSKESENAIDVIYPNPYYQNSNEQWRGEFSFPSISKPFAFQANNTTNGLERTVVYSILSQSMIPELEVSRLGYNKFQSIFKDFKGQSELKSTFKDILIKRKENQISIAKKVFSVGI